MKKKKGSYKLCWDFLKENKNYLWFALVFFLGISLISFFLAPIFPEAAENWILKFIEDIMKQTEGMGFFRLFLFIIKNNISTAFFGMMFGIAFAIFPIFNLLLNGAVLGFVMNKSVGVAGLAVLLRLIPHGIFEIPALIISLGLGIRLGAFVFKKNKKKDLIYSLTNSLRIFLFIILPLLLIAGLIETWLIVVLG